MNRSLAFLYKTVSSAYIAKFFFLLCRFFAIPLLLLYLSEQEYAAFALLSGLEGSALLLDFGMGTSLQYALSSHTENKAILHKTTLIYLLFFFCLSILFAYLFQDVFIHFLGGKLGLCSTLQKGFWTATLCFLLGCFGSVVSKALFAKQRGYLYFVIQGAAYLLSLALLSMTIYTHKLSLPLAIALFWGIPNAATSLLGIFVFKEVHWKAKIRWDLIFQAKKFFLFAVMAGVVSLSDTWIISRTLSIQQIIEYNVLCKIFGLAAFAYAPVMHALAPVWKNLPEHKGQLSSQVRRQCTYWGLFICLFCICIASSAPLLEKIFSRALSSLAIWSFGGYVLLRMINDFYTTALQSQGLLRIFFYLIPIQALIGISLQYFLSIYGGIPGLLIGAASSYILTVAWAFPLHLKKATA